MLMVNRVRQLDVFGAAVKMDGMIKHYEQVEGIEGLRIRSGQRLEPAKGQMALWQ